MDKTKALSQGKGSKPNRTGQTPVPSRLGHNLCVLKFKSGPDSSWNVGFPVNGCKSQQSSLLCACSYLEVANGHVGLGLDLSLDGLSWINVMFQKKNDRVRVGSDQINLYTDFFYFKSIPIELFFNRKIQIE
jgi:hypothetical protein